MKNKYLPLLENLYLFSIDIFAWFIIFSLFFNYILTQALLYFSTPLPHPFAWAFFSSFVFSIFNLPKNRSFTYFILSLFKDKYLRLWDIKKIKHPLIFSLVVIFVSCLLIVEFDLSHFFNDQGVQGVTRLSAEFLCGIPAVGPLLSHYFHQNCIPTDIPYFLLAIQKLGESLACAFLATVMAAPLAFGLAFFAARNLTRRNIFTRFLYSFTRGLSNIIRSIEVLVWATIIAVWIGIGPFSGMLALMVHSIASFTKQFSEAIEHINKGPIEAIEATGAHPVCVAMYGIIPQLWMPYLSFFIYRWDINVRMSTVIGLVGGGGIGNLLIQETGLVNWSKVGSITFLICIVVWMIDSFSSRIRSLLA